MKRLIIAIDCDDVLLRSTEYVIATYNQTYGANVPLEDAHKASADEWQRNPEEALRRIVEIQRSDDFAQITPPEETIRAIRALGEQHELHLVTARVEGVTDVTRRMANDYFPGCFTTINHVGPDSSKGDVCAVLRADVMIDDGIKHLATARDCGVMHRIWFGDYPWQTEDDSGAHTFRARDWADVEVEIARIVSRESV